MKRLLWLLLATACLAQDDALLQRLGSSDAGVRVEAMQTIRRLPRERKAALAKRLAASSPEVAMRLWRVLKDIPGQAVQQGQPGVVAENSPAPAPRDDTPVDILAPIALRSAGPAGRAWWTALAKERKVPGLLDGPPLADDVLLTLLGPASGETRPDRPALSPPPEGLRFYLALATHPSPTVRAALARWLDGIAGKEARVALEAFSRDDAPCVRVEALRALSHRLADKRDQRAFLNGFLMDPSPGVRTEAIRLFRACANGATDFVAWTRLRDPSPLVRETATEYLVTRASPRVLPHLVRLVCSGSAEGKKHAEEQALDLGQKYPLAVVALALNLEDLPHAGLPIALRWLDTLSREARWPGPTSAPPLVAGPSDPIAAWRAWAREAGAFLATDAPKRLVQADAALAKQDAATAEPILTRLLEEYPHLAHALSLMAVVCDIRKDLPHEREWLSKAIEADPAEASYRMRRAGLLSDAGDHAAALEDYGAAVLLRPEDGTARFKHGYELLAAGRYAEGVEEFRRVVTQDPSSLDARYNIACGLARQGDAEGALSALEDAFAAGFNDAEAARKDEDLASIHDDPRFEGILTRARGK